MADYELTTGWVQNPVAVKEVIQFRQERGDAVMSSAFGASNRPELAGYWKSLKAQGYTGVFLRDVEPKILGGKYRRPYMQKRGTCVSRGFAHAAQLAIDYDIVKRFGLEQVVEIAFAPIYSLARHECGKDRVGSGDGAILADAATALHDWGVGLTNIIFPGLTEDQQEQLAVKYAAPRVGTPKAWIDACAGHTCKTFWPETLDSLFDCIAAGYPVPYGSNRLTGYPNAKGIANVGSSGGHCRYFSGVFVDEQGNDQLCSSESWGRFPAGQPNVADQTMPIDQMPVVELHYADGVKKLAPGEVGVVAKNFYAEIESGGENWAVSPAKGFEPSDLGALA